MKPTCEGWYWHESDGREGGRESEVVKVNYDADENRLWVQSAIYQPSFDLDDAPETDRWVGPLHSPFDDEKQAS